VFSPFNIFFRDLVPTVAADWYDLVLIVDVDFDVGVVAPAVPRISTGLSHLNTHLYSRCKVSFDLKHSTNQQAMRLRDRGESENTYRSI